MRRIAPERRLPVGAEALPQGGVHFRVWAPTHQKVEVVFEQVKIPTSWESGPSAAELTPEDNGYFSGVVTYAHEGSLYRFRLDESPDLLSDPVSRFRRARRDGAARVGSPSGSGAVDREGTSRRGRGRRLSPGAPGSPAPKARASGARAPPRDRETCASPSEGRADRSRSRRGAPGAVAPRPEGKRPAPGGTRPRAAPPR